MRRSWSRSWGWIAMTGTSMDGEERRLLADLDLGKPSSLVWVEEDFVSFTEAGAKTSASYTFAVISATVWQPAETMRDAFVASACGASDLGVEVCSTKILGMATLCGFDWLHALFARLSFRNRSPFGAFVAWGKTVGNIASQCLYMKRLAAFEASW